MPHAYAAMMTRGRRYLNAQIVKGIAPKRALIALLTSLPDRLADRAKERAVASS